MISGRVQLAADSFVRTYTASSDEKLGGVGGFTLISITSVLRADCTLLRVLYDSRVN